VRDIGTYGAVYRRQWLGMNDFQGSEFEVSLDVDLVIDIDEYDWPPLPVRKGRYRGVVVNGRDRAGKFIDWKVRLVPAAVMEDGTAITEVWMSARHVGRDLALLANVDFAETVHTILQGGGAWRAEVRRADQAVDSNLSDHYEP
jgi:hypothetical protein